MTAEELINEYNLRMYLQPYRSNEMNIIEDLRTTDRIHNGDVNQLKQAVRDFNARHQTKLYEDKTVSEFLELKEMAKKKVA